jgi:hypothetical protein
MVASSYSILKGWWSGPILRSSEVDPQYGPPTIQLSNGRYAPNPLAIARRFAYETRGEGQFQLAARHYLNLRLARAFQLHGHRRFEVDVDFFNLPNFAGFQNFLPGAQNLDESTTYGKGTNVQPPRTVQFAARLSF